MSFKGYAKHFIVVLQAWTILLSVLLVPLAIGQSSAGTLEFLKGLFGGIFAAVLGAIFPSLVIALILEVAYGRKENKT